MELLDTLRDAPRRVAAQRQILEDATRARAEAARARVQDARARAHKVTTQGRVLRWNLETRALERVHGWLDQLPETPVTARVVAPLDRLVSRRLTAVTQPLEGFGDLNSRDAIAAVRGVSDAVTLHALRRTEAAGRQRKTVLAAIDARL